MIVNLKNILAAIEDKARLYNRNPQEIQLIAVSKTRGTEEIQAVVRQGQKHFGENYVQEAVKKIEALEDHDLSWHFIGSIQSNKTADIARYFSWVHTVDREKTALRLDQQRPQSLPPLNVCIEVNISGEASKSGVFPEDLPKLAKKVRDLSRLRFRGLMALPTPVFGFEEQREPFHRLAAACKDLQRNGFDLDTLSMGTTADYPAAIAEGATMIRLGTAIFGPRPVRATV